MTTLLADRAGRLEAFLSSVRATQGVSDVHLVGGAPTVRSGGRLVTFEVEDQAESLVSDLERDLSDDERNRLLRRGDVTVRRVGSFGLIRAHLYRERGRTCAALRLLHSTPPRFDALGLPDSIRGFAGASSGLVLLTGPVGVGKSSTLAALVREMDEMQLDRHARIIESPTEWIHEPRHMLVTHVSVGSRQDADSYGSAVSSALRSDAQVIVIGELFHDDETIPAALEAAVSGALVFATTHAPTIAGALQSLVDAFPPEGERRLRQMLADAMRGGSALRLLPRIDAVGRVPAAEVMVANDAIRTLIRKGDFAQLRSLEESGVDGMQTLEGNLNQLVSSGKVAARDARLVASYPDLIVGA
jgi:twitching motility protein PilT